MEGKLKMHSSLIFQYIVSTEILNESPLHFHLPSNCENREKYFNIKELCSP